MEGKFFFFQASYSLNSFGIAVESGLNFTVTFFNSGKKKKKERKRNKINTGEGGKNSNQKKKKKKSAYHSMVTK